MKTISFTGEIILRAKECTANKQNNAPFHEKTLLKDPFFSKHQEKATLGLGYKLTLEIIVNSVLSKSAATNDLKIDLKKKLVGTIFILLLL